MKGWLIEKKRKKERKGLLFGIHAIAAFIRPEHHKSPRRIKKKRGDPLYKNLVA